MDKYCTMGKHTSDADNFGVLQSSCRQCVRQFAKQRRDEIKEKGVYTRRATTKRRIPTEYKEREFVRKPFQLTETHKLCGMRWV